MNFIILISTICGRLFRFIPLFRRIWAGSIVLGSIMLAVAVVLKRNPARNKSPWIVGGLGLLMVISSGTQLIASFF